MSRWVYLIIVSFLIIMGTLLWLQPHYLTPQKSEVRGAIDIGSGTTNLKVAKVNPDTNKIISIIYEQTIPVGYQKQLELSPTHEFNEQVMQDGIASIKALKEAALQHEAKKVVAVATAAFRAAANNQAFAQRIEEQTGVKVRIIDQDEEGILAFRGALASSPILPEHAVVWDIGGGSMQFTALSPQGTYLIEHGKIASVPFRNAIIQDIEKKDLNVINTPNPMNQTEMDQAIKLASEKALETDSFFKDKILNKETKVLAVGNLFNLGIKPLVNGVSSSSDKMNQEELAKALDTLKDRSDEQLKDFAMPEVTVSNPLLVMGYMKGLDIKQVEFVSVNNADGALTYPAYWE